MCGFVGFTGTLDMEQDARAEVLEAMMNRIIHRGPDMGGQYFSDDVALGFRRLSILDLSEAGAQPMGNEEGTVQVVFNGEIYNFRELRAELEAAGYVFHSNTDTEVLVHGYEAWSETLVDHLRGMYSFVVYDSRRRRLFGARDIFGIKPFYWYRTPGENELLFGSEIKGFLEHPHFVKAVNRAALRPYLTLQYPATEETFFAGVFKLPAAHCFTFELETGAMNIRRYWDCDFSEVDKPFERYVEELDAQVRESVSAHRIADVKVGSFLSGGVDSSYITACLMPDSTFSVGFDYQGFNETDYAAELSERLGITNHRKMVSAEEFFQALPDIQYHMDEPQSNLSSVPLYFLAQMAAEQVTVVLSGEGADELFAGYEWYEDTPPMAGFKRAMPLSVRRALGKLAARLPHVKGRSFLLKCAEVPERWYVGQAFVYDTDEADAILKRDYDRGPDAFELCAPVYERAKCYRELSKKQYLDMNMWLPGDILLKADKMCMAHSLELRVPFLDRKVMALAERVPERFRVNEHGNKQVLRHAANRILPDEWATRPKKGFPVPFRFWLREPRYRDMVKAYFSADWAREFFDTDKLMSLLDDHFEGKAMNQRKIYTALVFLIWYKRFFIDESRSHPAAA
ncbi:asparagine synthase (glutamine-hydrolyzing) [Coriobacterium glomerans PW2]|uniref:asparagine synthase (glutamine-hydrolyzing) n=1 Tax=Coriobacterium glomerans (strain ATCC 49209 / DSM 20642 / JCM 10262 / PW2) TaxID=700015 RepID=F2NAA2_CORGP|nr:asparagine synthase (glutamine-hydrolyzing) [Coriobacterium glomerans]AEB06288.1 asparagine synthase (glutamine-hydrolyzing) [Coriobacterium glomerans PW2]